MGSVLTIQGNDSFSDIYISGGETILHVVNPYMSPALNEIVVINGAEYTIYKIRHLLEAKTVEYYIS